MRSWCVEKNFSYIKRSFYRDRKFNNGDSPDVSGRTLTLFVWLSYTCFDVISISAFREFYRLALYIYSNSHHGRYNRSFLMRAVPFLNVLYLRYSIDVNHTGALDMLLISASNYK